MIEVWTWPTPNGHKVHIALEELALPYNVIPVNIGKGEQFNPDFLAITPNHRIPAIVDPNGPGGKPITLFESAAILIYLAEKTGRLMPKDPAARYKALEWMMFQMGGIGPMFGQFGHFNNYAPEKLAYAMADIITYPWLRNPQRRNVDLAAFPNVKRWFDAIDARPAVQRGVAVLADRQRQGPISDAEREVMFGKTQFAAR